MNQSNASNDRRLKLVAVGVLALWSAQIGTLFSDKDARSWTVPLVRYDAAGWRLLDLDLYKQMQNSSLYVSAPERAAFVQGSLSNLTRLGCAFSHNALVADGTPYVDANTDLCQCLHDEWMHELEMNKTELSEPMYCLIRKFHRYEVLPSDMAGVKHASPIVTMLYAQCGTVIFLCLMLFKIRLEARYNGQQYYMPQNPPELILIVVAIVVTAAMDIYVFYSTPKEARASIVGVWALILLCVSYGPVLGMFTWRVTDRLVRDKEYPSVDFLSYRRADISALLSWAHTAYTGTLVFSVSSILSGSRSAEVLCRALLHSLQPQKNVAPLDMHFCGVHVHTSLRAAC